MTLEDSIREKLAAIEHERWADWQSWVHEVIENETIDEYIPRWKRQIATKYEDLSEREKQSDRDQVDRYWHIIQEYIDNQLIEVLDGIEKDIEWAEYEKDGVLVYAYEKAIQDRLNHLKQRISNYKGE